MGLQSVDRVVDVLEALAELGSAPLGEVSRRAGLPKSATHRLLGSLAEHGYVTQDPASGSYRLGLRVAHLAAAGLAGIELRDAARPHLERLSAVTGETVHLVVSDGDGVVYIDKVESNQVVRMASRVGMRGESHSTACGKAILAHLPEEHIGALAARTGLPARTRGTITSTERLVEECSRVQARGYAVDDEENEADVRCVGVAILDEARTPIGAISVSAPAYRLPKQRIGRLVPMLQEAAGRVTAGYQPGRRAR